jgi:hypothetical protein
MLALSIYENNTGAVHKDVKWWFTRVFVFRIQEWPNELYFNSKINEKAVSERLMAYNFVYISMSATSVVLDCVYCRASGEAPSGFNTSDQTSTLICCIKFVSLDGLLLQ